MSVKIRKKDDHKKIAALHDLARMRIEIGIMGSEAGTEHGDSGLSIATVGSFHEYGLGVPQRSFLRDWMTEQHDEIQRILKACIKEGIRTGNMEKALERAGAKFVGMVQLRIANRIDPPLAASTIARKGSDAPLIDTGILRTSITFRVVGQ